MIPYLIHDHDAGFLFVAVLTCFVTSLILSSLLEMDSLTELRWRISRLSSIAVVTGVGVWTTHFIAMIAFRPDIDISFDANETIVSALTSITFIGIPVAASTYARSDKERIVAGFFAGAGIAIMHYIGVLALDDCIATQSLHAALTGSIISGALLAGGLAARTTRFGAILFPVCFIMSVAATHSISLTGTEFVFDPNPVVEGDGRGMIGAATSVATIILLVSLFAASALQRKFQTQRNHYHEVLSLALNNMSNALLSFDKNGSLIMFNQRYLSMFGLNPGDLRNGMTKNDIVNAIGKAQGWPLERLAFIREQADLWQDAAKIVPVEFCMDDGRVIKLVVNDMENGGVVLTYDDITEEHDAKQKLAEAAFHDVLTGLPNRRCFNREIETRFKASDDFCLILFDLDRFKDINDSHGHHTGDLLLIEIARRLQVLLDEKGFVARLGGDELAILVDGSAHEADRMSCKIMQKMAASVQVDDKSLNVTCSLGICCSNQADNATELMRFADIALYEAKKAGRDLVRSYTKGLSEKLVRRYAVESHLRNAIAKNELALAYQPVVRLRDRVVIGYEALLRWNNAELGVISPGEFIPVAEHCGMMPEIGLWVIEQACNALSEKDNLQYIAINVSPLQMQAGGLVEKVSEIISSTGIDPSRLEIELTETAMITNPGLITETLERFRYLGVKIAMDDFGTGYSSLAHLRDFPFDRIKIDRSFVVRAQKEEASQSILKGIIQIARNLNVNILAEGVETEQQLKMVEDLGCDEVQGYYFGKPEFWK